MFIIRHTVQIPLVRNETLSNSLVSSVLEGGSCFGSPNISKAVQQLLFKHIWDFWWWWGGVLCSVNLIKHICVDMGTFAHFLSEKETSSYS